MITWPASSSQGAKPQLPTRRSIRVWSALEFMIADVEGQRVDGRHVGGRQTFDLLGFAEQRSTHKIFTHYSSASTSPRVRRT